MPKGYPDHEGGKSGVYPAPEWASFEATDKNARGVGANKAFSESASATYTVPAGVTFFLTQIGYYSHASAAADGDLNQVCTIVVFSGVTSLFDAGSNGGDALLLNKPLTFATGIVITVRVYNWANHDCNLGVSFGGYEK